MQHICFNSRTFSLLITQFHFRVQKSFIEAAKSIKVNAVTVR